MGRRLEEVQGHAPLGVEKEMIQVVEDKTELKLKLDDSYSWSPHIFTVGDLSLFLPTESHREIWEEHSELYGHQCVIINRYKGNYSTGLDDTYDVMFNIDGVGLLVPEVPQVWLRCLSQA